MSNKTTVGKIEKLMGLPLLAGQRRVVEYLAEQREKAQMMGGHVVNPSGKKIAFRALPSVTGRLSSLPVIQRIPVKDKNGDLVGREVKQVIVDEMRRWR